ncbi:MULTISPECIES: hypothetical protein [Polaromonas]|uniref:ESPR domain-containing protein n=1 Tax=Polaromonas aquatica TaxID=332657 RepID=A0ABW1TUW5_9BURK|nr:hypothetical protein [Polaromonas sp.]MDI1341919.1 hypothetical protein [Polaromonas sp.]
MKSGKFLAFNRRVFNAALASVVVLASAGVVGNAYAAAASSTATSGCALSGSPSFSAVILSGRPTVAGSMSRDSRPASAVLP